MRPIPIKHLTIPRGALSPPFIFCPASRFKNEWEANVASNQYSIYVPGTVSSLPGILGTLLTQPSLPFQKASVRGIMWTAEARLDAQTENGTGCISLEPLFNMALIRMMVSATNNWLVYSILSSQQLISSSVMKGPAVPGIMRITIIECLFLVHLSEYFACISLLGSLNGVLFRELVMSIHVWGPQDLVKEVKASTMAYNY